jgi:hypothetical protein
VTWVMWNLASVHSEIVLLSVQHRCTVCAKRTIGSEIVLVTPVVLLVDEAQVDARLVCLEIVLILMQYRSTVSTERSIGSEITLDPPSGTPRSRRSCGISLRSIWR